MASAHVTVVAPGATQGGYAVLTFRVPTESDTASTTGLKVQLPPDQPLASASVQPKPGWAMKVTKRKLDTPIKTDDGRSARRSARSSGPPPAVPEESNRASSTSS
ncbi:MAG: YcnI family protein [Actinomycetota bacterium]|nr:YcnI family protein [Actinomycetota bacterium]